MTSLGYTPSEILDLSSGVTFLLGCLRPPAESHNPFHISLSTQLWWEETIHRPILGRWEAGLCACVAVQNLEITLCPVHTSFSLSCKLSTICAQSFG